MGVSSLLSNEQGEAITKQKNNTNELVKPDPFLLLRVGSGYKIRSVVVDIWL